LRWGALKDEPSASLGERGWNDNFTQRLRAADFPDCLIGKFCTDWRAAGALMRSVTLPTKELTEPKYPGLPITAFEARVLRYLCWFGLMEKAQPAANDDWRQPRVYRKTALYERMLPFAQL
jgi:hypothetical protein